MISIYYNNTQELSHEPSSNPYGSTFSHNGQFVEEIPIMEIEPISNSMTSQSSDREKDEEENPLLTPSGDDSDVTEQEKYDLDKAAGDMPGDDELLREAALDTTDEDGDFLNEESFNNDISPDDLDVPGAAADDAMEDIGAEDEENNEYSLPKQDD